MRILIVGGSGFLGSELTRQCLTAKHEVAATYLTRVGETGVLSGCRSMCAGERTSTR